MNGCDPQWWFSLNVTRRKLGEKRIIMKGFSKLPGSTMPGWKSSEEETPGLEARWPSPGGLLMVYPFYLIGRFGMRIKVFTWKSIDKTNSDLTKSSRLFLQATLLQASQKDITRRPKLLKNPIPSGTHPPPSLNRTFQYFPWNHLAGTRSHMKWRARS